MFATVVISPYISVQGRVLKVFSTTKVEIRHGVGSIVGQPLTPIKYAPATKRKSKNEVASSYSGSVRGTFLPSAFAPPSVTG